MINFFLDPSGNVSGRPFPVHARAYDFAYDRAQRGAVL
jgi:hypothetical protein